MMDWFTDMTYLDWWIIGVVLIIAEVLISGFFLIWLGVGAFITGAILWLFPSMTWPFQALLFSITSLASMYGWRQYRARNPIEVDHPKLNRRGDQYVGRIFTLAEPIVNHTGKVRVDDSTWKVRGPDLDAGSKVEVTDVDGTVFIVEPVAGEAP